MRYYHDDHYTPAHPLSQAGYRTSGRAALPFWRRAVGRRRRGSGAVGAGSVEFETQIIGSGPGQGFGLAEVSGRIDGGSE